MHLFAGLRLRFTTGVLVCATVFAIPVRSGDDKSNTAKNAASATAEPIYEPGNGVTRPKLIHYVEPEFSGSSKEAFVEGVVRLSVVVKTDGLPTEVHVIHGLNTDEDHRAVDAVAQWRFKPGTKDGQPVNVHVTVEVEFHLL